MSLNFGDYIGLKISEGTVKKVHRAIDGLVLWAIKYTNKVPTSIDTDGSIYNGVGYKDNTRLSSSGSVSGTAQNGSVTTGFIPYKGTDVIRMKGAEWLNATTNYQGHYYINYYDSNKNFLIGLSSNAYSGIAAYKTAIEIVYDSATGVTSFDLLESSSSSLSIYAQTASYIRINAYGKGKDLIVTINEEIA